MMMFAMDAITRSLKDHVPTNLSFTANSPDDAMIDNQPHQDTNPNPGPNPEICQSLNVLFSDPELEQLLQKYNLKFNGTDELIEVCLVSIATTSHLLS